MLFVLCNMTLPVFTCWVMKLFVQSCGHLSKAESALLPVSQPLFKSVVFPVIPYMSADSKGLSHVKLVSSIVLQTPSLSPAPL